MRNLSHCISRIAATLFLAFATLAIPAIPARAETVSQKQAMQLAQQFFNAANKQVMAAPKMVYNGRRLTTNSLFPPFYIYNFPGGGFVIISAENKAFPILGYNLRENFDPSNLHEKEKALLTSYARDIERIRYDSRTPYEAIDAWNAYPEYVDNLLKAPYVATDIHYTPEVAARMLAPLVDGDRAEYISSTYTPDQWAEAIDAELFAAQNAVVGIFDKEDYLPMVLNGHKSDFYRFDLDGPNKSLYRLFATELLSDGQIASLGKPITIPEEAEPDTAFTFYDDFIAETENDNAARQRKIEDFGIVSVPTVRYIGSGHYTILMPEPVNVADIYNIGGSLVGRRYYPDTDVANLDISVVPNGFYIALLQGVSGKTYGIKLIR